MPETYKLEGKDIEITSEEREIIKNIIDEYADELETIANYRKQHNV